MLTVRYETLTETYLHCSSSMTASDCYNLALMLYKQEGPNYKSHAAQWFEVTLEKVNSEQIENTFTATEVMRYIIKSYHRSNVYSGWLMLKNKNIDKILKIL